MAIDFTADLGAILEDLGEVSVTYGGVTKPAIKDEPQETVFPDGQVIATARTVLVETAAFPAIVQGAAIVVGGADYVIGRHLAVDEGALTRIELADA